MRGFSVGFVPIEYRDATTRDVTKYGPDCKRVFSKWNLLELSMVPLPANQEAVAFAVSKGLLSPKSAKSMFGVDAKVKHKFTVAPSVDPEAAKARGQIYYLI